MKVAHLSVFRQISPGQLKQLRFEHIASKQIKEMEWRTVVYHDGAKSEEFINKIPWIFRSLFMRRLFSWIVAFRLSRNVDFILMRHITFDPFAFLFAPFIPNIVTVHHAKEIEELRLIRKGLAGFLASQLEKMSGFVAVRCARGIVGVTQEIADYERDLRSPKSQVAVYSNGIDPSQIEILEDNRQPGEINIAFICGTFAAWHGLDRLLAAIDKCADSDLPCSVNVHLIGGLSERQKSDLSQVKSKQVCLLSYGMLAEPDYRLILAKCDCGLGSLAMDRQSLREGSTLKVREMLAMGLAVFSAHEDVALRSSLPFARVAATIDFKELVEFCLANRVVSRQFVRDSSLENINKMEIMRRLAPFLLRL